MRYIAIHMQLALDNDSGSNTSIWILAKIVVYALLHKCSKLMVLKFYLSI